ncbi:hypothetical protein [Hymenobacter sp. PAMC 26628]|uniref:hypothetical protein n=1 Tax=Hymenobacter sp. PAMC 26628 TaxID=1484118 RepID=UPI0012FFBDCB|nr:hypothetical protein [Hymenobacter sp. PAMC 26628]
MKLNLSCWGCMQEAAPEAAGEKAVNVRPIGNSCFYDLTCPYGHQSYVLIQNAKFEILFQSGLQALNAGYYREAISSIAAALERFYEYSIMYCLCEKLFPGNAVAPEEAVLDKVNAFWAPISKHSERQFGAFNALYYDRFDESPIQFDGKFLKKHGLKLKKEPIDPIAFRNLVVHQGYIATREQAIAYAEAVNKYIHTLARRYWDRNQQWLYNMTTVDARLTAKQMGYSYQNGNIMGVDKITVATAINTFIRVTDENYILGEPSVMQLIK